MQTAPHLSLLLCGLIDPATGLANRVALDRALGRAVAEGRSRALVLLELEGLRCCYDEAGAEAGDAEASRLARALRETVGAIAGSAYRLEPTRFALLVPADGPGAEQILLAASARSDAGEALQGGRWHGSVTLPQETAEPARALQLAGQRVTAFRQRQQLSARRQAHAVLMAALGARRPELRRHVRDVAFRSIALSRRLGLDSEAIDDVFLAAELQDVGLLTVPESVLEKSALLDEEESRLIRQHPIAGERIVAAAPGLAQVATIIRSISERYDGSGFPDRLIGEEIPVGARIITVLVAFAAMTATRPYRPAREAEDALAELRRCAGTQFDPVVVEAFAGELAP